MKIITLLFTLLIVACKLPAQKNNLSEVERDLINAYNRIEDHRINSSVDYDTLDKSLKLFRQKMLHYASTLPATLSYSFDSLQAVGISITSSDDSLLRIYSWDNMTGGTMRFYESVVQYRTKTGIHAILFADTTEDMMYWPMYTSINTLKKGYKTYYLIGDRGRYSTSDMSESFGIWTFDNDVLNDTVRFFKDGDSLSNSVGVEYDFFSIMDSPERKLELLEYDSKSKMIYVAVTKEFGKVTNDYQAYKYNGQYFENVGERSMKQVVRAMRK